HSDSVVRGSAPDGGISGSANSRGFAHLPVVIVVVSHEPKRLAAVTAGSIRLVDCHCCAIQHAIAEYLVGVVVERRQKSNTNLIEILEVRIGNVAGGAVVFDEILIILVIRSSELRERAQVVGRAGVGLERTGRGWARRIVPGGLWPHAQGTDVWAHAVL